eukprot:767253-Hanusia_phi.AAC.4
MGEERGERWRKRRRRRRMREGGGEEEEEEERRRRRIVFEDEKEMAMSLMLDDEEGRRKRAGCRNIFEYRKEVGRRKVFCEEGGGDLGEDTPSNMACGSD